MIHICMRRIEAWLLKLILLFPWNVFALLVYLIIHIPLTNNSPRLHILSQIMFLNIFMLHPPRHRLIAEQPLSYGFASSLFSILEQVRGGEGWLQGSRNLRCFVSAVTSWPTTNMPIKARHINHDFIFCLCFHKIFLWFFCIVVRWLLYSHSLAFISFLMIEELRMMSKRGDL